CQQSSAVPVRTIGRKYLEPRRICRAVAGAVRPFVKRRTNPAQACLIFSQRCPETECPCHGHRGRPRPRAIQECPRTRAAGRLRRPGAPRAFFTPSPGWGGSRPLISWCSLSPCGGGGVVFFSRKGGGKPRPRRSTAAGAEWVR